MPDFFVIEFLRRRGILPSNSSRYEKEESCRRYQVDVRLPRPEADRVALHVDAFAQREPLGVKNGFQSVVGTLIVSKKANRETTIEIGLPIGV